MDKVQIEASAKVNLSLNIDGKREDGYHLLSSLFQSIDLKNSLTAERSGEFSFSCNDENLPLDERNTAVKAVKLFSEKAKIEPKVKMHLVKNVPYGAGMGSASSDGAAALKAMELLYPDILEKDDIMDIALKVGADVPFSYVGGTSFVRGIGEELNPLPLMPEAAFLIVMPPFKVSTKEAYRLIDEKNCGKVSDNEKMIEAVKRGDLKGIAEEMENAFYYVSNFMENEKIRESLIKEGALNATLTGSGSALFGLFDDEERALFAKKRIKGSFIAKRNEKALFIK